MKNLVKTYISPHAPVIIPEIGSKDTVLCASTCDSMRKMAAEIAELNPDRIVIITPHGPLFSDALAANYSDELRGDFSGFMHDGIGLRAKNDMAFIDKLAVLAGKRDIVLAKLDEALSEAYGFDASLDHGISVPLYFIDEQYKQKYPDVASFNYKLVAITYGLLGVDKLYDFGKAIREGIESSDKKTVFIASGDLSHCLANSAPYQYSEHGMAFDEMLMETLKNRNVFRFLTYPIRERELAQTCAYQSVAIMFGLFDKSMFDARIYSYAAPFGVGYLVASLDEIDGISPPMLPKLIEHKKSKLQRQRESEDDLIRLARDTIEYYVINERRPFWDRGDYDIPNISAACFISLKSEGNLRACLGTIYPSKSDLFQEIVGNAVSVCTDDDRFEDIDESELEDLSVSVDVISTPEIINGIIDLDPKIYGIVVETGDRRGVLLPDIDGINTPSEQIKIALNKAQIWQHELYTLKRFTVERHEVFI